MLWTKASVKVLKHKCKLRCPPSVIGFHFWINYIKIRRHNRHGPVFACMFYLSLQSVTTPGQPPAASAWCRLQTWHAGEVLIKGNLRRWMSAAFCCSGCCLASGYIIASILLTCTFDVWVLDRGDSFYNTNHVNSTRVCVPVGCFTCYMLSTKNLILLAKWGYF